MITTTAFAAWLNAYGAAWGNRDDEAITLLFTPDGSYQETPFDPPMVGHDAIRRYWVANVIKNQRDIVFSSEILAVTDTTGIAHWRSAFTRTANESRVELDGIFRCAFTWQDQRFLCTSLREWWHLDERRIVQERAG